jgi:hypothetical protein
METVYKCGNYGDEDTCRFCDAEPREPQPGGMTTVTVSCPGWYSNNE